MSDVFYWLLNMSITASVTGLPILLIRRWKRLPRRLSVLLWAIPFLRMTLPFGLNSPYSLMSLVSSFTGKTLIVYRPAEGTALSMTNFVMQADSYFPITYKVSALETVFLVASVIWLVFLALLLLILAVSYVKMCMDIRDAEHWKGRAYVSHRVKTPAVYGVISPKIILPVSYRQRDTELVLLHESMHIRSADNLWRLLASLIVAVHWFNPFAWWFLKEFLTDLELACDERVLLKIGERRKKEYALSLLESRAPAVFVSAFGGAKLRPRVEHILRFQTLTWASATVFLVLVGVMLHVLLTNAA